MTKIKIILIAFLLASCGSVKKSSTETDLKTESEKNTEIDATKFSNSFTLEPINLDKPILLGKDTIYNTRVIYNNSKEVIKEKRNEVNKSDLNTKEDEKEVDNGVLIDKVFKYLLYLILIVLFAMWLYNSLNPIELIKKLFKNKNPL